MRFIVETELLEMGLAIVTGIEPDDHQTASSGCAQCGTV
jgi:hypothetical protein